MKRATIVIVATVAGLVAVLSFHTAPSHLTLGSLPEVSGTRSSPSTSNATTSTSTPSTSGTGPTPAPSSTTTTAPATTRKASGEAVNYHYGVLSVAVTVTGTKITDVGIASLDDGGNFRSQSIDQQSIPLLEQQAMEAQGANIQGVSGASYTTAGFEQSLQSALNKVGFS